MRLCVIIPCYNHGGRLPAVLGALQALELPVIVVDDASDRQTAQILDSLAAQAGNAPILLRHAQNQGKGGAVLTGMREAARRGFTHALQIDADGQHDVSALPALLAAARDRPWAVVSGRPVYDASVPASRRYGRLITQAWVYIETLSFELRDVMCGLRVYPLAAVFDALGNKRVGLRMDFDVEILVRLFWAGVPVRFLPVRVTYPKDGLSHFHPLRDNLRISWMHTRLVCTMIPYVLRRLTGSWRRARASFGRSAAEDSAATDTANTGHLPEGPSNNRKYDADDDD